MPTNNADLVRTTLLYASACLENGEWAVLRDLNFGEQEIDALAELNLADVTSLVDRLDGHALDIQLDRERFWLIVDELKKERAAERIKTDLICREAPADMMRQLFGMTDRQYTAMRRRLHCNRRSAGRPPDPEPDTMDMIWAAWHEHLGGREPASAGEWLALADDTGIDCRTLWRFIRGANAMERSS